MVDDKKLALEVQAVNLSLEDYGAYVILALPLGNNTLSDLYAEFDREINLLQTELITDYEYQKLQNIIENSFVNSNSTMAGIANSLARYYMLYDDTNLINSEIDIYKSITKDDILRVANTYLNQNQRVYINYMPEESE